MTFSCARIGCWLLLVGVSCRGVEPPPSPLDIRPEGNWGAEPGDVRKVLEAAAREIWQYFPGRSCPPIVVSPKGGPITLYRRGPAGEIRVKLDVSGPYWAQYTFQFAHELGHVLSGFDEDPHRHRWFEESVCEAASLFVLRRSVETWKTRPPYPHWTGYSKALANYAADRLARAQPPDDFARWFRDRRPAFEKEAEDRERNLVVAVRLLPLFEKDPRRWEAVTWLNREAYTAATTFEEYLAAWQRHCPERHKGLVKEIARVFDVNR